MRTLRIRPYSSVSLCRIVAVFAVFLTSTLVGCRPDAGEVESAAMTDGDVLATGETEGAEPTEVTVVEAGPAAWSCQRYLDLSDETGAHFDEETAGEAEDFADDLFRSAEIDEDGTLVRPDVPLRTALRDACSGNESATLADVLRDTFGRGAA